MAALNGFTLASERLHVTVDGECVEWDHALAEGDEVVFPPPISYAWRGAEHNAQ